MHHKKRFLHSSCPNRELLLGVGEESTIGRRNLQYGEESISILSLIAEMLFLIKQKHNFSPKAPTKAKTLTRYSSPSSGGAAPSPLLAAAPANTRRCSSLLLVVRVSHIRRLAPASFIHQPFLLFSLYPSSLFF
ncbi:hypothetical protein RIF29_30200 [Crotalaria pallida]|uniref:Uncharacterized protein n=1 Tax=Crotalaria pallida TaxID=3830 RepID=A0AAN9EFX3_CROPI